MKPLLLILPIDDMLILIIFGMCYLIYKMRKIIYNVYAMKSSGFNGSNLSNEIKVN
jgi:hypothetical protein